MVSRNVCLHGKEQSTERKFRDRFDDVDKKKGKLEWINRKLKQFSKIHRIGEIRNWTE